ncbi:MAG: endonuclease [Myxococcales bacterium]|nr:endonuclease [Myxococcales bacterium]
MSDVERQAQVTPEAIADELGKSLHDGAFSRSERKAFSALLSDRDVDPDDLIWLRRRAFAMARSATRDGRAPLDWLEAVTDAIAEAGRGAAPHASEAYFSPGEDCRRAIAEQFGRARVSVDVCVFTITDDHLSAAIMEAHGRGVAIRIVSDDEKSTDTGSDINTLRRLGVAVAIDTSPSHMHHKFAIFDRKRLVTGSYNWTRSAFAENQENIILTAEPGLVSRFQDTFDALWTAWH